MTTITVLTFDPAAVNCGIITGTDRSLIVDAGPGPTAAGALAARAAEISREANGVANPIDLVITHDHWDHYLGAAALVDAGIDRVFASPAFAADQAASTWIALDALRSNPDTAAFARELPEDPGDLLVEVTPIAEAGETPTTLDLGDAPVELSVLGGHSTADVVVSLPEAGVVFTGDLIEEGAPPQAGSDASLSHWVESLHALLAFPQATVFVPGHGVPVDRAFVERQVADLDGFRLASVPNQSPGADEPAEGADLATGGFGADDEDAWDGAQEREHEHGPDAEVTLPSRAMPGDHDRTIPRETTLPQT
ncbi:MULTISPECIES: MBL fold metallo-hydrolase [unclassified Brevibacterium]|uniref:MBL fold metallo-hydrolase n=1 Tax=unclassified Brevibacterium TaxID=2614124 RepID=UPI001BA7ADFE|nr:MBL fold metallo-hydrolase [Brevibacterium sp. W7.2]